MNGERFFLEEKKRRWESYLTSKCVCVCVIPGVFGW